MSIHEIIARHPDVAGEVNEALATAARHAMFCALMDMSQCVRTCIDCADVCTATSRLAVRRTGQNVEVLRAMLETCIRTCELCAEECERHAAEHGHCELSARMCRECADDCRKALPTVN